MYLIKDFGNVYIHFMFNRLFSGLEAGLKGELLTWFLLLVLSGIIHVVIRLV